LVAAWFLLLVLSLSKVYPSEVEKMILGFGGILECAVVGKKDKDRGEVLLLLLFFR